MRKIRKTKIVATIGPSSSSLPVVRRLLGSGVDVVRFNVSHSSHEFIGRTAGRVRRTASKLNRRVALLGDLQGPRVRLGRLGFDSPSELHRGETVELVPGAAAGDRRRLPVDYDGLMDDTRPGDRVLINDGLVELKVLRIGTDSIHCRVVRGGEISDHKGLTLPSERLSMPFLSDKDRDDLDFALDLGVDYIALSFVRHVADIEAVLNHLGPRAGEIGLIAKIESPEAIKNIDRLLKRVDGVLIARGDLALECSIAEIPILQKKLIRTAIEHGLPAITATQMLESMVDNPTPTRAEATDIANAVLDGTDALMLSAETAVGSHPVEAVRTMDAIAKKIEQSAFFNPDRARRSNSPLSTTEALARAAADTGRQIRAKALVAFTMSGRTAVGLSNSRPQTPIFALSPDETVARRLALHWGVTPLICPIGKSTEGMIRAGERVLLAQTGLKEGNRVVLIHGTTPFTGGTNLIKVHVLGRSEDKKG